MEHKKAADVLIGMLKKHKLSTEEKEAISTAVGVLALTYLAQNRLKSTKAKREKNGLNNRLSN